MCARMCVYVCVHVCVLVMLSWYPRDGYQDSITKCTFYVDILSNLLSMYLKGDTKSVLIIRSTYYQG